MKPIKSVLKYSNVLLFFFVLLALFLFFSLAQESEAKLDRRIDRAYRSIQPMEVYRFCKTMCGPEFAGRFPGHEGYTAAARWAANLFKQWGLKPMDSENGYLQPYPSPYVIVDQSEMILYINGKETKLEPEKDFLPLLFSDSGSHRAPAVFVGWGIHAPELGYDDYEGVDVKGKFVLCFRGTPQGDDPKFMEHDQHRHRMNVAKERGSLGLIYINEEIVSNPNGDWIEGFTPANISYAIGDKILSEKGLTSAALEKELSSTKKPKSFDLKNTEIDLRVQSRNFPKGTGYNVVGILEGSDPVLKNECMVIGGHFDHNGKHMGLTFSGANDNASGSADVMVLAHAFSLLKVHPKRSIVFVLFGSEETGLKGSHCFDDHLPKQFTKVDAMFNFDMTGEGDGTICGLKEDPQLEKVLRESDNPVKTLREVFYMKQVGVRTSDYAPFFLRGASCIAFFSNGPHIEYHKSTDNIYRVNPDMMCDIARLAFLTAVRWSDRPSS
ncbi:MAG: M28 family peptidase [Candidatus Omnitrophota bacterium]